MSHSSSASSESRESSNASGATGTSRRAVLKSTAFGMAASSIAGCTSLTGGGGSGDTLTVGHLRPASGPLAALGTGMEQSIDLAAQLTNEDDNQAEIEVLHKDTKGDPATARNAARELVTEENVDVIAGTITVPTENAATDFAKDEDVLVFTNGASTQYIGADCYHEKFNLGVHGYNAGSSSIRWMLEEERAEKVYSLVYNYDWGRVQSDALSSRWTQDYGEHVGNSEVSIGQGDFSPELTAARNSEADTVFFAVAGSDAAQLVNSAWDFGLFEDYNVVSAWMDLDIAEASNQEAISHDNYFAGTQYYWEYGLEQPDGETFVEAYRDEYDEPPDAIDGQCYAAQRTLFNSVGRTGSTDTATLASDLEGRELDEQIWNVGEFFQECNHNQVYSQLVVEGKAADEVDEVSRNYFNVVDNFEDPSVNYQGCQELGCQME